MSTKDPFCAAHCGECNHPLYGDTLHAYCINKHCPQFMRSFVVTLRLPTVSPVPEPEKEYA